MNIERWAIVFYSIAAMMFGAHAACGGASAATRTSYAIEEARCIANERAIVGRQGTSAEQDRADLAAERSRCDAALAALRGAP